MEEKLNQAMQRHADHYLGMLFKEDIDPKKLTLELPQIALAKKRLEDEEVGFAQHVGMVDVQYLRALQVSFGIYLARLMEGKAVKEDVQHLQIYVKAVEMGELSYPVAATVLRRKLNDLEKA